MSDATCLRASRVPENEADKSISGTLGSAAGETPGGGLVIAPARRVRRWCWEARTSSRILIWAGAALGATVAEWVLVEGTGVGLRVAVAMMVVGCRIVNVAGVKKFLESFVRFKPSISSIWKG